VQLIERGSDDLGGCRGSQRCALKSSWLRHGFRKASACALFQFEVCLLAALLAAPACQAAGWGGSLGATSDYVFRGLSQSDGGPAAQADLHYYALAGAFGGLWASSVKQGPDSGTTAELNAYLGYARRLADDWSGRIMLVHYAYPGSAPRRRYDYDEAIGTIAWRDRLILSLAYSPDNAAESNGGGSSGRSARSCDLALHQPLPQAFSLNAAIGYNDLRGLVGRGYVYWNAGLAYDFGHTQLDLSYIGTDDTARSLFGSAATRRLTATLLWHF